MTDRKNALIPTDEKEDVDAQTSTDLVEKKNRCL